MNFVSKVALGSILTLTGVMAATAPAAAQRQAPVAQGRTFTLTKEERAAILPLQTAIMANNYAAAAAALPAAQSAAKSADARYFVAQYQLRLGIGTGSTQMQSQAIEAMLASGVVPAADLPQLYNNQAALAAGTGDLRRAEAGYSRLVELTPNDPLALITLAEVKNDLGKISEAVPLMDRAITAREAAGQPVPEGWYKRAVKVAYDAKIAPQALKFSRGLAAAYPSQGNWRDAVLIHRELAGLDQQALIDLFRLKRAAKALAGERDYQEMATLLNGAGLPGEAKAVLDEGAAQRMVDPSKAVFKELIASTNKSAAAGKSKLAAQEAPAMAAATGALALTAGDAFQSYGDYARAASLYRAAVQKGAIDPNVANTRLGVALAMAGQRAEAEAAFRSVTGPNGNLAALWLAWLARRA